MHRPEEGIQLVYQLEVKRWLVTYRFPPSEGWIVYCDIDAMERANGGQHRPDKSERARIAEASLREMGVKIGPHPLFGRADIVAEHPSNGLFVVEVEGDSSRQKEQALYSALGQLVLQMDGSLHAFMLAVPDEPAWERQFLKISPYARSLLKMTCVLVSANGVRQNIASAGR